MRILVIGSGGREAALAWRLAHEGDTVFCAPGNPGIAEYATCISIHPCNIGELVTFAHSEAVDFTVAGFGDPLIGGIADRFRKEGLPFCGPSLHAARIKSSRSWFKELLKRYNIPAVPFEVFHDHDAASAYIEQKGARNIVIKTDGVIKMNGKGVTLPRTVGEACEGLSALMKHKADVAPIVIEDRVSDPVYTATAITDGCSVFMLPVTRKYSCEYLNGAGRYTESMGAHTLPLSRVDEVAIESVLRDVVTAFGKEGCPYKGFLSLELAVGEDDIRVLSGNCCLSDPEGQTVLPVIGGSLAMACAAAVHGNISHMRTPERREHAVCLVLTSKEGPNHAECEVPIFGLNELVHTRDTFVFHAGTTLKNDILVTDHTKRVLHIVARGNTLRDAKRNAYGAVQYVHFSGMKYRKDIGEPPFT